MQHEDVGVYYPPPVKFWRTLFGLLGLLIGLSLLWFVGLFTNNPENRI